MIEKNGGRHEPHRSARHWGCLYTGQAKMWHLSSVTARGIAVRLFGLRPLLAGWRVELQGDVFVKGKVWAPGRGRLHIGRGVRLIGEPAPIELRAHEEAEIWIEDGVLIEGGTSIEAARAVRGRGGFSCTAAPASGLARAPLSWAACFRPSFAAKRARSW